MTTKEFDPSNLFQDLKDANLDPSIFDSIDERDIPKAPNFITFATSPKFLRTEILPKQIEIGSKLFADYCPHCSKPGYIDTLFDQSIGNIQDNIEFLEHGVCLKCKKTRYDLIEEGSLTLYNELVAAAGQRCVPVNSLVYSEDGLKEFQDTKIGELLTHGPILNSFRTGKLKSLKVKTKYNWTLVGAKDTHIVPTLGRDYSIEFKKLKECKEGDLLLLHSPRVWPEKPFELPEFVRETKPYGHNAKQFPFPKQVTPELARLVGYLISDGQYTRKWNLRIMTSNVDVEEDVKRCCLSVFGEEPSLEGSRECKLEGFDYKCWSVNGTAVMEWLSHIGLKPASRREKHIPDFILQSPKNVVSEFLAGLFGGDGNIYQDGSTRLQYTSVSKTLIKQLRLLLLNFGIVTRCDKLRSNGFGKPNSYGLENIEYGKESFQQWPKELQELHNKGYFSLPIVKIEDGPELEMMDIQVPDTNMYTADGFVHHNSGKSKFIGLASAYLLHRFLKISNPLRFFRQPTGELLTGTFSALDAEQAKKNLWNPFKGFIDSSPWFNQYHSFLKEKQKELHFDLFHERATFLQYNHKQIHFHYLGSIDRKMRGPTRILGSIDELGWFRSDEDRSMQIQSADNVYAAISNSLATMRMKFRKIWSPENYDAPMPLMLNASSPSGAKDKIMRLLQASQNSKKMLAYNQPSWEWNPDYTYESLREEFSQMDDRDFARDFGAEPPLESKPFIAEQRAIERIATGSWLENLSAVNVREEDNLGDTFKSARAVIKNTDRNVPRLMSFDLGHTKNALGFCLFSISPDFKTKLDFILQLVPEKNVSINFVYFFDNFVLPVVEAFNIKYAFYDRWQSLDQVQRLRDKGVDAQVYSMKYADLESVRGSIITQGIIIPQLKDSLDSYVKEFIQTDVLYLEDTIGLLALQLLTMRDLGHKMTKPLLGNDDLGRAFCLGAFMMSQNKIKESLASGPRKAESGQSVRALGTVRSFRETGGGGIFMGENGNVLGMVRSRRENKS